MGSWFYTNNIINWLINEYNYKKNNIYKYFNQFNLDGIILSGGNDIGENFKRDLLEDNLLQFSKKYKIPLLGICRGMQMIQHFMGGELCQVVNHVSTYHKLISNDPLFMNRNVNSYHNYGILENNIAINLLPIAISSDGVVEAFKHINLPWLGIMWHPERNMEFDKKDKLLIRKHFKNKL